MSFTDNILAPTLVPNPATAAVDTFNQELAEQTTSAEQELDGGQSYDAAQANRIVSMLRELSDPATEPEAADAIEAQLAELGITDARGGTTPQIVAQLTGIDDPAHATEASISAQLAEQGIDLPESFWHAGLDQNWQVLESIIADNSRDVPQDPLV